jgi:hypothetical protein
MLTPHQIAKLFVVSREPARAEAGSPDVESLIEQSLVRRVDAGPAGPVVQVTALGADLVARLANATANGKSAGNHRPGLQDGRVTARSAP